MPPDRPPNITLAISTNLPAQPTDNPPVIFVHGAGTTGNVWTYWCERFVTEGWPCHALDLRGHGASSAMDLSRTSIWDYVAAVETVAAQLSVPPVVIGWSMGGHIAVMAASRGGFCACVALDPDPPADSTDDARELAFGQISPADIGYDLDGDPDDLPGMPDLTTEERAHAQRSLCDESILVRTERRRGIIIEGMPCPLLEIIGGLDDYYPTEPSYHGIGMANHQLFVERASHFGLMFNRRVLPGFLGDVLAWMNENSPAGTV